MRISTQGAAISYIPKWGLVNAIKYSFLKHRGTEARRRGKREEGRGKREEGRGKREEGRIA